MRRQYRQHRQPGTPITALGVLPQTIVAGMVILPGPQYRAVLETSALGVQMFSEEAADILEAGYHRFLAGLDFPVQMTMRAYPAGTAPYVAQLQRCLARETDPALIRLVLAQVSHVERLITTYTPLERRFYVIVPAPDETRTPGATRRFWRQGRGNQDTSAQQRHAATVLGERCQMVAAGLRVLGLRVRRLDSPELAALWYGCLCPRTAPRQPLQDETLVALDLPIAARHARG